MELTRLEYEILCFVRDDPGCEWLIPVNYFIRHGSTMPFVEETLDLLLREGMLCFRLPDQVPPGAELKLTKHGLLQIARYEDKQSAYWLTVLHSAMTGVLSGLAAGALLLLAR